VALNNSKKNRKRKKKRKRKKNKNKNKKNNNKWIQLCFNKMLLHRTSVTGQEMP
jgi:hypothetical protein